MLNKLNILAPYLALALLGYLTYSALDLGASGPSIAWAAHGKETIGITRAMLKPELIEPSPHGSPVDRDPFEVSWSSYLGNETPKTPTTQTQPTTASMPAASNAADTKPAVPDPPQPPPLPRNLGGVFISEGLRKALIDDKLYGEGQELPATDDGRCWVVRGIQKDAVVLQFGQLRQTLRMATARAGNEKSPGSSSGRREGTR